MCGRYALTLPPEAVRAFFAYAEQPNFPSRFNIAPTQPVPVVTLTEGRRRFILMRWGFLPSWVKDPKTFPLVINVRSETAAEKASFRNALKRRRCLMPADSFYEWQRVGRDNRAFLFRRPDRGPFAFAAIHETWIGADGGEIDTVALFSTIANGPVGALLKPPPDDALEMIRVGPAVNKVANDGPDIQLPFAEPPPGDVETTEASPAARPAASPLARRTRAAPKAPDGSQGSLF